jgi:hypothetical protein
MASTSTEDLAEGIPFVVDWRGEVTGVVLSPETWRQLIARLEDAEDRQLLASLAPKLATRLSSALAWSAVEHEWT